MQTHNKKKYAEIMEILTRDADAIQKLATIHHKKYLGGKVFRSEFLIKYINIHKQIVRELVAKIPSKDIRASSQVFKEIGLRLAKDSIRDKLTLQESVDGTIFLKQAIWQFLKEKKLVKKLTVEEFYDFSFAIGTYCDVLVSQIAFAYHNNYSKIVKKAARHKNEFMSMATHELKTPVTSLKAYAQALKLRFEKEGDESSAIQLTKMDSQINKLTGLIGDLLETTKIESGKLQYNEKYFDLNELILEVVEETQRTTPNHVINIQLNSPTKFYGDKVRISQVLTNLLSNAIKYSPNSKNIIVSTRSEKRKIIVSVQDFGIGIEKKHHKKIFNRFKRVNDHSYGGLGLGLFIASTIVKHYGGIVFVDSTKSKGSTFSFTLPIKRKSKQQKTT